MTENKYPIFEDVGINKYAHREYAVGKLKRSYITFPSTPQLSPEWIDEEGGFKMPHDLTALDSRTLGRLMSELNGLLQWYGAVLASAKVDLLSAERIKTFTEARVRMSIFNDPEMLKEFKAREDKEAFVNTHPDVVKAQEWYAKQQAVVMMTEQLYHDYDRSFRTVSREISRRGSEFDRDNRVDNIK